MDSGSGLRWLYLSPLISMSASLFLSLLLSNHWSPSLIIAQARALQWGGSVLPGISARAWQSRTELMAPWHIRRQTRSPAHPDPCTEGVPGELAGLGDHLYHEKVEMPGLTSCPAGANHLQSRDRQRGNLQLVILQVLSHISDGQLSFMFYAQRCNIK